MRRSAPSETSTRRPGDSREQVVDEREDPKRVTIAQRVGHEIHRPALGGLRRSTGRYPRDADALPPTPVDVEARGAVHPLHALPVDPLAIAAEEPVQAAIAPAWLPKRQRLEPRTERCVIARRVVALRRPRKAR